MIRYLKFYVNKEVSIDYVMNEMRWNQKIKVNVDDDDVFTYNLALYVKIIMRIMNHKYIMTSIVDQSL